MMLDLPVLAGPKTSAPAFLIEQTEEPAAYFALRHRAFVQDQGLFAGSDRDDVDDDPRTVVLVARASDGTVLGGVRLWPATEVDLGWWQGGRLVASGGHPGVGSALVRAACAHAERLGVLRFEATVQSAGFFQQLGWKVVGQEQVSGVPHTRVRWPIGRAQQLADATKRDLGALLQGMHLGGAGFVGDDGSPVPGSDLVAACDAILPAMVERDPEWAGWCSVLVNVNDLAAMGAAPVGLLDAVAGQDSTHVAAVLRGLRRAAEAWGVPVLGGHTQTGVPASLAVTALGRTASPVPAGGGQLGENVYVTADLGGSWRPGYTGRQWDSTSFRGAAVLQGQQSAVARALPSAAKDVSMAGLVGTLGMLAEASGVGAVLDVARVPRPDGASVGDWLTCFPGFAMLSTARLEAPETTSRSCGALTAGEGVRLRWPDGVETTVIDKGVTGLGTAA
jgi:putative N-acetyltransferase (TIGR04045 family)